MHEQDTPHPPAMLHPAVVQDAARRQQPVPPSKSTPYVPHPHSPEGRVDRMEEQLLKLLMSISHFAQVGELQTLHQDVEAQVQEFQQFRQEVRAGMVYRQQRPRQQDF